jgi:hypothetical protein
MKYIYLILIFLCVLFIGCYSNYTVQDFSSKDKFYEDFNKSAKTKDVTVILSNDSSFEVDNGVALKNDTLFTSENILTIDLTEIERINYTGNDYKSGSLLLKNGDKLNVSKIRIIPDSITFITNNILSEGNRIAPISKVKTVSYKVRWLGTISGFLIGMPLGYLTGVLIGIPINHSQEGSDLAIEYKFLGVPIGAIIGSIVGSMIGFNYTYHFSP